MTFVVVTTWLLIQAARGSERVWSTSITQLWMKNTSTPGDRRKFSYITTSNRLAPYLGQPQLADQQGSSVDLIYPADPSQEAPQPGQPGDFTRAKYVSIGAGYVRANDPSAALRQMEYGAVPTSDPAVPEYGQYGAHNDVLVKTLPTRRMSGARQHAPPLSAFFNRNASSSQSSIATTRSYPYPFPTIPPSEPQSRPTSHQWSQPPLNTQPPDRDPLQDNQKSNGNKSYDAAPAQEESFRARGNNRQTNATAFSLSPYYAGKDDDDDASSVASRYSMTTTMTRANPNHSGTVPPPISVLPPPPKLPPLGPPPPIPMRSPRRQSFARSEPRVNGQQGSAHPFSSRKV